MLKFRFTYRSKRTLTQVQKFKAISNENKNDRFIEPEHSVLFWLLHRVGADTQVVL